MGNDKNIVWHDGEVSREDREKLLKQKGVVVWFTGFSGSGKSTVSRAVEKKLFEAGHLSYVLDGDNIRHGLNSNLAFSEWDRRENVRRIGEVAKLFADSGIITITAFISPFKEDREKVRKILKNGEFIEVYVKCSLEECERRDVKGLYEKARTGEIAHFTGISSPYEEPENPEIIVESDSKSIEECADKVISYLKEKVII